MRYILWDFDGTLANRDGMWSGALRDALITCIPGSTCSIEKASSFLTAGFPWHDWATPHQDLDSSEAWWNALFPVFTRAALAFGLDDARAQHVAMMTKANYLDITTWQLVPEALEVLATLKASGWTNVIISNHVPELSQIIDGLGITPFVEKIFCSAHIGVEKPHPYFFDFVLARLEPFEYACVVGDNPDADVAGARQAQLPSILVGPPHPAASDCVSTLREAAVILEERVRNSNYAMRA